MLVSCRDFLDGSPAAETERQANERQHEVTLTQGFWMAKTETTQAQWEAVMSGNPSQFKGSRLPVDSVTWDEAKAFAQRCTRRLRLEGKLPPGWEFQLPSEAQWEYACRAGTATAYFSGDGEAALGRVGWYDGNSMGSPSRWKAWLQSLPVVGGRFSPGRPSREPKPVGQKEANAFGLQDMHGNAREWCEDWYGAYEEVAVAEPLGPRDGDYRVLRGGSWNFGADWCRAAYRSWGGPVDRFSFVGFRVCLVPGSAAETETEE